MELEQRCSVSMNEYDEGEGIKGNEVKTENVYQFLRHPSTQPNQTNDITTLVPEHNWRKCVFLLFAVNVLILTIILAIVGMNYSLQKRTHLIQVANGQRQKAKEEWLLYDNVFYLFWSERSDCSTAVRFCSERNASLVTSTETNKVWLQSRVNGNQFFSKTPSDGSGDSASDYSDEEDEECDIMNPGIDNDHSDGFVCERKAKPYRAPYIEPY